MTQFDRLTTLMNRFTMQVEPADIADAALVVMPDDDGQAATVVFRPHGGGFDEACSNCLFAASVTWGGGANPLLAALPEEGRFNLQEDSETRGLIDVLRSELVGQRCGAGSVVNRLGEVLIVRLLRKQIEAGTAEAGALAGLADPRLSRAIVSIHDHPGRDWRNEDLAHLAGLSLSRFANLFHQLVGESPASYLRNWRLTLAWQDVERGDRIDAVARRYGYASTDGFSRAFKKHFGLSPIDQRMNQAG